MLRIDNEGYVIAWGLSIIWMDVINWGQLKNKTTHYDRSKYSRRFPNPAGFMFNVGYDNMAGDHMFLVAGNNFQIRGLNSDEVAFPRVEVSV